MTGSDHGAYAATQTGTMAAGLAPGTVLADRFVVESLLGIGGMGVVYRARDRALDVPVALKLLRPELATRPQAFERFRQELLLARQVSSPHVVRIHDIAIDDGRWFITMDFVDGEALDRRLDRDGALPVETALAIARQVALGLQAAHAVGIVHRDLKPSNILVDAAGNALISDFGIARSIGSTGLTHSGAVVGTPDYLSPEQARGATVDGRSDLYALGLILYEMISGEPAFAGGTPAESLGRRLVQAPPLLDRARRDVPAWVARLVDRLLQPRPARRPADAAAVVTAIDRRALPRQRPPLVALLVPAVVVLALLAVFSPWRRDDAAPPAIPAAPTTAVPDRVAVVVDSATPEPELLAIAEALRLAIGLHSPRAAVAAERSELAWRRAGLAGRDGGDAALAQVLPAARTLRLSFAGVGAARTLQATWSGGDTPAQTVSEPLGDDPAAAARRLFAQLRTPLQLGAGAAELLPADAATLRAHGRALQPRQAGRMEDAADAYAALAEAAPGFAPAWLGLAQSAQLAGQRPRALDAAARGAALPGALQAPLVALQARLDGDPAAQAAALEAWLQARPDDLDARLALADVRLEAGEFDAAIADLQTLLARDPEDARAWFLRGKAAILQGEPRLAVDEHLVRALVLFKRGRSLYGEAETTNALGVGYARLGQTGDAEEQYRKALQLRRQLGDRRGSASSLRNLAQLAIIQGRFADARADLDEARTLFAAIGDDGGGAAVDNELGLLAEEQGDYATALAAYKRALRGREAAGDRQGAAESLNNIGFAHYQLGDYDNAQVFWRQARAAFAALDDHNGLVRADQNLGLLQMARGDWAQARATLEQSLAEAQARQMQEEAAVSRRNLAELALLQGRYAEAGEHVARARALFAEREDQRGLVDADLLQAALLAGQGQDDAADAALATLAPALAEASAEQQALAALQRAELAQRRGARTVARAAIAEARAQADRSGVQALRLRVRLLSAPDRALGDDIAALGNLSLQLQWLHTRIDTLAARDPAGAVAAYAQAQALLAQQPDWAHAAALHAAGARALAAAGDADAAAQADAAAVAARARVAPDSPPTIAETADVRPR